MSAYPDTFEASGDYDAVLFGGANSSGYLFGDTWQFDNKNYTWWNVTPNLMCTSSTCPSARHDAAMYFDAKDGYAVLFGGCGVASPSWTESIPECGTSSAQILGDTWTYGGSGTSAVGIWTKLSLSPPNAPSARYGSSLAPDPSMHGLILFGGCGVGTSCPLSDTWNFVFGAWTQIAITSPPPARYGAAMGTADISGNAYLVLFGGCGTSGPGCVTSAGATGALQDTWLFYNPGTGLTWVEQIAPSSCSTTNLCPSPRFNTAYTSYASGSNVYLELYGGVGPGQIVLGNDTDPKGGWWFYPAPGGTGTSWAEGWSALGTSGSITSTGTDAPWNGTHAVGPPYPEYSSSMEMWSGFGTILFGGSSATGSSFGDTWFDSTKYTGSGLLWPPPVPTAQYFGSMAWDAADHYQVLAGGCGPQCGNASTWAYHAHGSGPWGGPVIPWQDLSPPLTSANSPSPRVGASLAYFNDTAQSKTVVVLFGGLGSKGSFLGDTWVFSGVSWTQQTISGPPSGRELASFAYNSSDSKAVLFGGCGSTCPLSDTWLLSWSITTLAFVWTQQSPTTSPPARYGASSGYDPVTNQFVVFGGCGSTCPLSDTWTYSDTAMNWKQCTSSGCTGTHDPPARWGAPMTYDVASTTLIMYGGCGAACPRGDTWGYSSLGWANLTPTTPPPPSFGAALSYDPTGQYVLLQGGSGPYGLALGGVGSVLIKASGISGGYSWTTAPTTTWSPRAPVPAPRFGGALAFNSTGDYALLVGGCQSLLVGGCGPIGSNSDTWEFQNGSWHWVCTICGPSARYDSSIVFDGTDGYFLLVGGCAASSTSCSPSTGLDDVWKFGANHWTSLSSPPFSARGDANMAWDQADGVVILFGGIGCTNFCSDSWSYSAGSWTSVTVPTGLGGRYGAAITYDGYSADKYVVMEGGKGASVLTDTWSYTAGGGWIRLLSSSFSTAARYEASMAYDSLDGYVILLGGVASTGTVLGDTWEFRSGSWTSVSPAVSPPSRWGASMMYDPAAGPNGFLLVFSGDLTSESSSSQIVGTGPGQGDMWQYLGNANPPGSPIWVPVDFYT